MHRLLILIFGSICLAVIAGIVNFEILPDPAVTITNGKGEMQLFVYLFFLGIGMTCSILVICFKELSSSFKHKGHKAKLPEKEKS